MQLSEWQPEFEPTPLSGSITHSYNTPQKSDHRLSKKMINFNSKTVEINPWHNITGTRGTLYSGIGDTI